jgi:hypothetical protein
MAVVGRILLVVALVLLVGAVVWWYLFFEQILGDNVKQASDCFYYTTDLCSFGAAVGMVSDIPTYSPLPFWGAAISMVSGLAMIAGARRKP